MSVMSNIATELELWRPDPEGFNLHRLGSPLKLTFEGTPFQELDFSADAFLYNGDELIAGGSLGSLLAEMDEILAEEGVSHMAAAW